MPRLRTAPLERTPVLDALPGDVVSPVSFHGSVSRARSETRTGSRALAYLALTKPRIIELLLITTVPTMFLAQRGVPGLWLVLATLVGGSLAAGGANAINMYVDRDIDKLMARTQSRPLVTGVLTPRAALSFAITIEALAFVWLWGTVNLLSAVLAVSACAFYVFVYTLWLKRTSRQNIVIGGAAGAVPVLVGWAAVTNSLAWAPIVLFAVIFVWTPPHFWSLAVKYREDYQAAHVPMLPAVATLREVSNQVIGYTAAMVALTLVLAPVAQLGPLYFVSAVVLGALFLLYAVRLRRAVGVGSESEPGGMSHALKPAMALFGYSITYVTLLFFAIALDQVI